MILINVPLFIKLKPSETPLEDNNFLSTFVFLVVVRYFIWLLIDSGVGFGLRTSYFYLLSVAST